jgi:hypothetical protein
VVRAECVYNETDGTYSWWEKGVELKFEYVDYNKLFLHFFMWIEMCRNSDDKNLVGIISPQGINPQETSEDQIKQIAHDIRKLWRSNVQTRFATCCNLWGKTNNFSRLNKLLVDLIEEFNLEFNKPDEVVEEEEEEYYDEDVEMGESGTQTPKIQPEPEKEPEKKNGGFVLTNCQKEFISMAFDLISRHFEDSDAWNEVIKETENWKPGDELNMEMISFEKLFLFAFRYGIEPRCNDIRRRLEGITVGGTLSSDEAADQVNELCNLQIGKKVNVCCEYWNSQEAFEGIRRKVGRDMAYFNENYNKEEEDDMQIDEYSDENDYEARDDQIVGKKRSRSRRNDYYDSGDEFDDDDDNEEEEIKKPKKKKVKRSSGMPILDAVRQVLSESKKSLHGKEIAQKILGQGLIQTNCDTFRASVTAQIYTDIKNKGERSDFEKTGPMTFKYRVPLETQITETTATDDAFVIVVPDLHSPMNPIPVQIHDN